MGVPGPSTNGTIPVVSPPRDRPMSLVLTPLLHQRPSGEPGQWRCRWASGSGWPPRALSNCSNTPLMAHRRKGRNWLLPLPKPGGRSRQDRGDAEYGFGLDLGAGILWSDPQRGISGELKGRTLLSHGEEDFQGQGLALSFSLGTQLLQPQTIPLPQLRHGRHCNG